MKVKNGRKQTVKEITLSRFSVSIFAVRVQSKKQEAA
jgi:hypothetical protein